MAGLELSRYARRIDVNQPEITAALRRAGCSVQVLSMVGHGCPDLLVGVDHNNVLLEVKDGTRCPSEQRLTPLEQTWHDEWRGTAFTVNSVEAALQLIGDIRRGLV